MALFWSYWSVMDKVDHGKSDMVPASLCLGMAMTKTQLVSPALTQILSRMSILNFKEQMHC